MRQQINKSNTSSTLSTVASRSKQQPNVQRMQQQPVQATTSGPSKMMMSLRGSCLNPELSVNQTGQVKENFHLPQIVQNENRSSKKMN